MTSLAGATGDLAAYLAFACVVAQVAVARGKHRRLWLGVAVLCAYGVAVTQTLTAVIALTLASALLWVVLLPRHRVVLAPVAFILCLLVSLTLVSPLRQRLHHATHEATRGRVNDMLVGRLDAWWAVGHMLQQHPVTGVGLGAYGA